MVTEKAARNIQRYTRETYTPTKLLRISENLKTTIEFQNARRLKGYTQSSVICLPNIQEHLNEETVVFYTKRKDHTTKQFRGISSLPTHIWQTE